MVECVNLIKTACLMIRQNDAHNENTYQHKQIQIWHSKSFFLMAPLTDVIPGSIGDMKPQTGHPVICRILSADTSRKVKLHKLITKDRELAIESGKSGVQHFPWVFY